MHTDKYDIIKSSRGYTMIIEISETRKGKCVVYAFVVFAIKQNTMAAIGRPAKNKPLYQSRQYITQKTETKAL